MASNPGNPEPPRLVARPHHGHFPIPFVTQIRPDGRPDFRVHDHRRRQECAERRLCQLCGQDLGERFVFVGFSARVVNRHFGEPPMHLDCMEWAWRVCPWLAGAGWRDDWGEEARELKIVPRPTSTPRWMVLYVTDDYRVAPDPEAGTLKWIAAAPCEPLDYRDRLARG